jgi:hypothetical protein
MGKSDENAIQGLKTIWKPFKVGNKFQISGFVGRYILLTPVHFFKILISKILWTSDLCQYLHILIFNCDETLENSMNCH